MTSAPKDTPQRLSSGSRPFDLAAAAFLGLALVPSGYIAGRIMGEPLGLEARSALLALRLALIFGWAAALLLSVAPTRRTYAFVALSALFALAGFLRVPYFFDRYNYTIYFSLIDAYQGNPVPGDWFTAASAGYNGYYLFARAMALLPREYLPGVFYILWGLGFPALGWIFIYLGRAISGEGARGIGAGIAAYAVALAAFDPVHWSNLALGDHGIFFSFLTPQIPAQALGMAGLLFLLRGRAAAAGACLGLAIDAHLNTGQLCFALFIAAAASGGRAGLRNGAIALGIALVVGALNLLPAARDQLAAGADAAPPEFSYVLISGYLRHPHHLIPSSWSAASYARFAGLVALAAAGWFLRKERTDFDRGLAAALAACLALCLAGWFFVEIVPLDFAAKSQLFRATALAQILALPYAADFCLGWAGRAMRAVSPRAPIAFHLIEMPRLARRAALGLLIVSVAAAAVAERRILPRPASPVEAAAERLTPPGAVFLLPLRDGNLREFPVMARRGVFVDWHRFPFQGRVYVEWHRRVCALMGVPARAEREAVRALARANMRVLSQSQSLERLEALARAEGITHVVRSTRIPIRGLAPIWSDEDYLIYELPGGK